jgi:hypothetical protein
MIGDLLYYDYRTLFNAMHDVTLKNGAKYRCIDEGMILDLPTADVRENVHGEWKKISGSWFHNDVQCSECGNTLDMNGVNAGRGDANFCPNCGADMADMRGEQNGQ